MAANGAKASKVGKVLWQDLTVGDAETVRTFYEHVVGWKSAEHAMPGYADYEMKSPGDGQTVAGVCHARGTNASVPPQWLVYFGVKDVQASIEEAKRRGGAVIDGPRDMGGSIFAVVKDPAGAVCALMQVE